MTQSKAELVWGKIKDKEIDVFAIAGQKVSDFFNPVNISPDKCYLEKKTTASAALPALESVLGTGFQVDQVDRFIVVELVEAIG